MRIVKLPMTKVALLLSFFVVPNVYANTIDQICINKNEVRNYSEKLEISYEKLTYTTTDLSTGKQIVSYFDHVDMDYPEGFNQKFFGYSATTNSGITLARIDISKSNLIHFSRVYIYENKKGEQYYSHTYEREFNTANCV
ncbi:hypothetical protein C9J01_19130 [Photobacterium rosenbergii]|uniref:Shiga toxin A subunit n=1 Tax=Photobacterium rosenbergii TaxID=294936 RepID=A0A2T3N9X8_9GAMM|nr:hypothetical protein C9J01_19130 [Photobacterium rosenbergii]